MHACWHGGPHVHSLDLLLPVMMQLLLMMMMAPPHVHMHAEADCLAENSEAAAAAGGTGGGSLVTQLLLLMMARSQNQAGLSWCVGVGPPVDAEVAFSRDLGAMMASTVVNRKVHPAVGAGRVESPCHASNSFL